VDQSEQSNRALGTARDLASLSGGSVRLIHVREQQVIKAKGGGVFDVEEPEDVSKLLQDDIAVCTEAGVPVSAELRHAELGDAASQIVGAAKDSNADVIVMGSRGRSELAALFLGSTAYKVLHLAHCPVLVVH
jgi:nucleotide-binding universal stress UspA family protein